MLAVRMAVVGHPVRKAMGTLVALLVRVPWEVAPWEAAAVAEAEARLVTTTSRRQKLSMLPFEHYNSRLSKRVDGSTYVLTGRANPPRDIAYTKTRGCSERRVDAAFSRGPRQMLAVGDRARTQFE
jgi:hypothetical protein